MHEHPFDYYANRRPAEGHHHHGEGEEHPHHPVEAHDEGPPSDYEIMSRAMQELLEAKGIITADEVRQRMEVFEDEFPYRGARVVAHAWVDPVFRERLLADGKAAVAEFGIGMEAERLIAVENTPEVHNVIVCTLCSCYPRSLLGQPPAWYRNKAYRSRVVREPRKVLAEFGSAVPDDVEVHVHDSNADLRFIVLPMQPAGTGDLGEAELAALVTRDSLIGVAPPRTA